MTITALPRENKPHLFASSLHKKNKKLPAVSPKKFLNFQPPPELGETFIYFLKTFGHRMKNNSLKRIK